MVRVIVEIESFYFVMVALQYSIANAIHCFLQVLQSALFTFDLIESVLARIEEIAEAKGRV